MTRSSDRALARRRSGVLIIERLGWTRSRGPALARLPRRPKEAAADAAGAGPALPALSTSGRHQVNFGRVPGEEGRLVRSTSRTWLRVVAGSDASCG